jgi:dethiobiotin synthetase
MRLGCLNHALLTADAIDARGLTLAGWIANGIDPNMARSEENIAALQQRLTAPLLGILPWQDSSDPAKAATYLSLP